MTAPAFGRWLRRLLPLLVLAALAGIAMLLLANPPAAPRGAPPEPPSLAVEVLTVTPQDYRVTLASYGTVQPRTRSLLVAQVAGQVMAAAPTFRPGGFFRAGDVLLTIDPRDYEANVQIAQAALADARTSVAQEDARAEQALVDWQRLGKSGTPGDLVLRQPQLQAARARVASAAANLAKAELALERTRVRAPFDGRLLDQRADLGQVVSAGTPVADVYATDRIEVRLPLRNDDLAFINLPEGDGGAPVPVLIRSTLGKVQAWQGEVVRTEGAIDANARQLHVVAQVPDPFNPGGGRRPLKIGEYVTAEISGEAVPGALVVPASSIYQGNHAWVVEDGVLARRTLEVAWQNGQDALVSDGLAAGDQLVLTPLGQVTSGLRVRILGEQGARVAAGATGKEAAR